MKHHGIGVGYQLPHDYEGGDASQQYLPDAPSDRCYDEPMSGRGNWKWR